MKFLLLVVGAVVVTLTVVGTVTLLAVLASWTRDDVEFVDVTLSDLLSDAD